MQPRRYVVPNSVRINTVMGRLGGQTLLVESNTASALSEELRQHSSNFQELCHGNTDQASTSNWAASDNYTKFKP